MNFFEAQDTARRSTGILVVLFLLAIAALVMLSNFIVFEYIYLSEYPSPSFSLSELKRVYDVNLSILISVAILGFICLGSLYKLVQLSSGGSAIAQYLGGVIVPRSSSDPLHKKILNVVEEMAIASGTPVPQVYILNEQGINAFAAGWKTTNAVIGITQGALERLSRDELQGVIAHEFSHIFNGDMRLNIRLIAILHGILMIGMLGRMILRSLRFMRSSRHQKGGGQAVFFILAVGGALAVVGYTGTFFGNLIKSMISRQREYLADASAVQFTRNSDGIANALKKIGGAIPGSAMLTASVDEYSHAYFALGDNRLGMFSFSTHPPLKKRIYRIQPGWDGKYIIDDRKTSRYVDDSEIGKNRKDSAAVKRHTAMATGVGIGMAVNDAMSAVDDIGAVSEQQIDAAQQWHVEIPDDILSHAENPYGAQALILALLMHDTAELEKVQLDVLYAVIGELHTKNVIQVKQLLASSDEIQTLPLIDLSMPTLREMTVEQYQRFDSCVKKLVLADKKVDLREWIIQRVVLQHLQEHYGLRKKAIAKYFVLGSAKHASELMLSLLAYIEHGGDEERSRQAFESAKKSVGAGALSLLPKEKISYETLNTAMDELELYKPPIKRRFLQACIHCISYDGRVTIQGYELTRAIASCLDCPMPPVLVDRPVPPGKK